MTTPIDTRRPDNKVITSSLAALAVGVAVTVLNLVLTDASLLGSLPAVWQSVILLAGPPLLTGLVGYSTRPTLRVAAENGPADPGYRVTGLQTEPLPAPEPPAAPPAEPATAAVAPPAGMADPAELPTP